MMFCGSKGFSTKGSFDSAIHEREGRTNAASSQYRTNYEVELPQSELRFGLESIYQLAFAPLFTEESFKLEREIVFSEIAQTYSSRKDSLLGEMFPGTKVSQEILGSEATLKTLNPPDLFEFHQQHYHARNATLFIAGNLPAEIGDLVDQVFGNIPSAPLPDKVESATFPAPRVEHPVKFDFWGSDSTSIDFLYHAPVKSTDDIKLADILEQILSGESPLSLKSKLRHEMGVSYSAKADLFSRDRIHWFNLYTQAPKAKSIDAVKGIKSIVKRLFAEELDKKHVYSSIVGARAADRRRCMDQIATVNYLQRLWRNCPPTETPDRYFENLLNFPLEAIQDYAKQVFDHSPSLLLSGGVSQAFMEKAFADVLANA
jgi:predicted Zn-dependent peptidase